MVFVSPVLDLEDYDDTEEQIWEDNAIQWLCHEIANEIWDLSNAQTIELYISDKYTRNSVVIRQYNSHNWGYCIHISDLSDSVEIFDTLSDALNDNFSLSTTLYAWIYILESK